MQEFYYAHPETKTTINDIFNTHFYGAPLWDLFSTSFQNLEKSWNTSQRLMLDIPRSTHRYLIEPLSGRSHIVCSICKRFLTFSRKISQSRKTVLNNVLKLWNTIVDQSQVVICEISCWLQITMYIPKLIWISIGETFHFISFPKVNHGMVH